MRPMPAVRSASGPISVPACEAPISMGTPSRAMRWSVGAFGHEATFENRRVGKASVPTIHGNIG